MIGAIIGDIVGSRFEFNNRRSKEFRLFAEGCYATDDSVLTLAVGKALMKAGKAAPREGPGRGAGFYEALSDLTVKNMRDIGRRYPDRGYGGMFARWLFSRSPKPYRSYGNGAAMRVSPAGLASADEQDAMLLAEAVTRVTHDHPEGIKGAQAVALAIHMARTGASQGEIRVRISREFYPLDFTIDAIRDSYVFNETCQETVPQAVECFLESNSFEDAIRTAVSLGGDSDTVAAICGSIAEAYYGVPADLKSKALGYLDDWLRAICDQWEAFAPEPRTAARGTA
ncbi:MAG: ADP-ribosylglycohydrolase family protein [Deltaproteobacteria bacterium]|jgi:type I restriction enzyme M protein|nr:ADP-ribosylglycohydrolase family protein [Deltaproteobacteria bacterium]